MDRFALGVVVCAMLVSFSSRSAGAEEGVYNPLNLALNGRLQLDYDHFNGAYNATFFGASDDAFYVRRARLNVSSQINSWDARAMVDVASQNNKLVATHIRYRNFDNGFSVQAGKLREEVSLNALTSSKHINTIERSSFADSVAPYYQWGVAANRYNRETGFRYAVGVYQNEAFGAQGEGTDGQLSLALSGRVTWQQTYQYGEGHIGGWFSKRDMGGRFLNGILASGEVRKTNVRLLSYAAGGSLVRLDSLEQAGLEGIYQNKGLTIEAEYAVRQLDTQNKDSALDDQIYQGYSLSLSYFPSNSLREYSSSSAVMKQPKGVSKAWEWVARISDVDATSDEQGTRVAAYTLGANYFFSQNTKVMMNAIYSKVSGPGTAALVGQEDSGLALSARLQYLF